ncbi:hypothetical protein SLA2020_214180 [Shorea laevis]
MSNSKWETNPKKRVVITKMGLMSLFGNDVDVYHDCLWGKAGSTPSTDMMHPSFQHGSRTRSRGSQLRSTLREE